MDLLAPGGGGRGGGGCTPRKNLKNSSYVLVYYILLKLDIIHFASILYYIFRSTNLSHF